MGTLVNPTKTLSMNTDEDIYRHHSSDIDLIEPSLDEPDTEFDFWTPISRRNWIGEDWRKFDMELLK